MLIRLLTILISVSISFLLTSCSEQDRGIKELTPVEIAREYLLKIGYKVPVLYSDESYFLNYFTAKDSVYEGVGDSLVKYETESPYKECRRSDFCTQLLIARNGLVFIPFQVRSELGGEKGAYITAVIVDTIFNYAIGNLRLFHSSGLHKYDSSFTEPYDLKYKEKSVDESKKYLDSLENEIKKEILVIKDSLFRHIAQRDSILIFDFNILDIYTQRIEMQKALTEIIVEYLLRKEIEKPRFFYQKKFKNDTLEMVGGYHTTFSKYKKVFICINGRYAWMSEKECFSEQ